jgi:hypothetical protein
MRGFLGDGVVCAYRDACCVRLSLLNEGAADELRFSRGLGLGESTGETQWEGVGFSNILERHNRLLI